MNIREFALSEGITETRAHRAATWALEQTGRKKNGIRSQGGTRLTDKEMALCREWLKVQKPGPKRVPKETPYPELWGGWRDTWLAAITEELNGAANWERLNELISVYGCLCIARDRTQLEMAINGARLGDVALELCYSAGVDFGPTEMFTMKWRGFTAYLLEQGYESPGWGVI